MGNAACCGRKQMEKVVPDTAIHATLTSDMKCYVWSSCCMKDNAVADTCLHGETLKKRIDILEGGHGDVRIEYPTITPYHSPKTLPKIEEVQE